MTSQTDSEAKASTLEGEGIWSKHTMTAQERCAQHAAEQAIKGTVKTHQSASFAEETT